MALRARPDPDGLFRQRAHAAAALRDNGEVNEPIDWSTAAGRSAGTKGEGPGIVARRQPRVAGHHPEPRPSGQSAPQALHEPHPLKRQAMRTLVVQPVGRARLQPKPWRVELLH